MAQTVQPLGLLPRQRLRVAEICFVGFFYNKSGFSGAFCLHGSAGASASCGQRWKDALVTGCQAAGSPPSAPAVLPQGVRRELGAALGSSYSWGWRGAGPVCPGAPCRTDREYSG